ncbi:hypothetical protein FOXG_02982 [Fusarium oxysporum f. sp. lycopersici 4287]|uniref:Uncharacterized protein n=2 Tax=Fusarium oxysporum TaxID=5507 RepID=A0A0J9UIP8_FUSO4|nr:hypothetical protein FOXG_02982 [Fusarium oxysporum f. sp. lycopersici 4287]KNA98692.1 hypothetical protein FOXG_02982 [Fusarium oxysporum f. sp. lycopersici 4287]
MNSPPNSFSRQSDDSPPSNTSNQRDSAEKDQHLPVYRHMIPPSPASSTTSPLGCRLGPRSGSYTKH